MRKILFITPHYPPSNLAAVHRTRLFAQHLPAHGWEPLILTVDEKYYEESLDWDLHKLLPANQRIFKTKAFRVTKPRLIGDIGLRGFIFLFRKAADIIQREKVDFLYIPIPSFYGSILGRLLHLRLGIPYGIDYIDPWVQVFPGSHKVFSRHWWSTRLSTMLEPYAVRRASIITGVAEGYYRGVYERNPHLLQTCLFKAMPYGGESRDHEFLKTLNKSAYLFSKGGKFKFVYAGAMLPKAYAPLGSIFKSISSHREAFENIEFHFIGTGSTVDDENAYTIRPFAEKFGLWQSIIFEYPKRIPYLDVLTHLDHADGIFILGSTEPHYTPSKTYQGVLSGKPIFAVLHSASTAVNILRQTKAGIVLDFDGEAEVDQIEHLFIKSLGEFRSFAESFNPKQVDLEVFNVYSAASVTSQLAKLLDKVIPPAQPD